MRLSKFLLWLVIWLPIDTTTVAEDISTSGSEALSQQVVTTPEIPSPLLPEDYSRPYVSISALGYMPSLDFYPVRVITINDFAIKPLLHGYEYRLQSGTYVLEVLPDFSLLGEIENFMNESFKSKRIEINLTTRSSYLLGARINPENTDDWRVELLELGSAVVN
jgi:hypothetical protein